MQEKQLTLSVLIPTLGRKDVLIETVESILAQSLVPDEIIIVDQNDPPISELVHFFEGKDIVRHMTKVSPGVVLNYNRCLHAAKTDIIVYLDDDVDLDKDCLKFHYQTYLDALKNGVKLGGVAGRVENREGDKDPNSIKEVGVYHKLFGTVVANFNYTQKTQVSFAQGANMSFYREVLLSIGGFDLSFDGNGYFFESDCGLRVKEEGYEILFEPQAYLYHKMASSGGARVKDKVKHTYYFMKNGCLLFRRHSPKFYLPFFLLYNFFYLLLKSLKNFNWAILSKGLKGLFLGLASGKGNLERIKNG